MTKVLLETGDKTYCWKRLTKDDSEEVAKLMGYFSDGEPLSIALKTPELKSIWIDKGNFVLAQNMSIGAYESGNEGRLCSMCLTASYNPADFERDHAKIAEKCTSPYSNISRLEMEALMSIQTVAKEGETFLWHYVSSTDPDYQNKGISTALHNKLEIIAREQNCRYIVGYYTSKYSGLSAKKLGYKLLQEEMYADMVDPFTKEKKFDCLVEIHTSAKAMYLDLGKPAK